jgi:SIR2-like domain
VNVYILGAGVSAGVRYPLGGELFDAVDKFIRELRKETNTFVFDFSEWPGICKRLENNENSLIRYAYRFRHFEHLMTALDHNKIMLREFIKDRTQARKTNDSGAKLLDNEFDSFYAQANLTDRQKLLSALAEYFRHKHSQDRPLFDTETWSDLKLFGEKLNKGDTILTFNYDSCMERTLLACGKWSPKDGFGFVVDFVDEETEKLPESDIRILHLHGCTGWYKTRSFYPGRTVSLSSEFLECLGLFRIDSTTPDFPAAEPDILMHPTYLKTYELSGGADTSLIEIWRSAADALRRADNVFVIGYSLPEADSAALALLLGACDSTKIAIVNQDPAAARRLSALFGRTSLAPPITFAEWVRK